MRTRRATTIALASAAAITLTSCASNQPHTANVAATRSTTPSPSPSESPTPAWTPTVASWPTPTQATTLTCEIYLYGRDARLIVNSIDGSDPTSECANLAKNLSASGDFWTTQIVTTSDATPPVCAATLDNWVVLVRDGGSQIYGQSVCSDMIQAGWVEDPTAEQQAQQQDAQAAQAQAQASAQAASVTAAQSDLNDLETSNSNFTNASKVTGDLTTTANDLSKERQDAANGPGDNCYNVQVTVAYDAQNDVGYDVMTSASYDVNQEQQGVNEVRAEIARVQQDQATLQADGLPGTPEASSAIELAQSDTTEAIATTNSAIDKMNGDLEDAYTIANAAATGSCAGDGPGTAPEGLSPIS